MPRMDGYTFLEELAQRKPGLSLPTIVLTADSQEALTLLRTSTPCIILLDLIMPSMNGYTFLEIFGQREPQTSIPIIVITADVEAVQRLADRNIPVLLKPFKFSTLLTAIQQSC